MRIITCVLIILLILLGVGFAALNSEPVTINLYIHSYQAPLAIVTVLALGIGLLSGLLMSFFVYIKMRRECRRAQNQ